MPIGNSRLTPEPYHPSMRCSLAIVLALLPMHVAEAWWIANLDRVAARLGDRWMRLPGPVQAVAAFPILFFIVAITKVVRGAFIYFQF